MKRFCQSKGTLERQSCPSVYELYVLPDLTSSFLIVTAVGVNLKQ